MINIIESAIITIIISFISGLLLEYYKNLSPRILCNLEKNKRKVDEYILTIKNISNKIIHDVTVNVQTSQSNLKIEHAKITKGLKFDSSIEGNMVEVDIPFLDKDDEFSVTVYMENKYGIDGKPVVIIRSPEKFKQVDSVEQKGILSSVLNIPKIIKELILKKTEKDEAIIPSENNDFTLIMDKIPDSKETINKKAINKKNKDLPRKNRRRSKNKVAIIGIASIVVFICGLGIGKLYFDEASTDAQTPSVENSANKQPTNVAKSEDEAAKNTNSKISTSGTSKNSTSKSSASGAAKNASTKTGTDGNNQNTGGKTGTSGNTDTKTASDGTSGNVDTKPVSSGTTKSTDTNTAAVGTTGSTDTKTVSDGTTKNTDAKSSTNEASGSTAVKSSVGGTTGGSGN